MLDTSNALMEMSMVSLIGWNLPSIWSVLGVIYVFVHGYICGWVVVDYATRTERMVTTAGKARVARETIKSLALSILWPITLPIGLWLSGRDK